MGWEWGWNKPKNGVGVKIGLGLSGKRIGMRLEWGQEQAGSGDRVGVPLPLCLGPPTLLGSPVGCCVPHSKGSRKSLLNIQDQQTADFHVFLLRTGNRESIP